MAEIHQANTTDKNLDKLSQFLMAEMEQSKLATQIPDGAHLFHGSYNDMELTQANIKMAASILIEMVLGLCAEAPLLMIFEHKPDQQTLIDLSTPGRKQAARTLLTAFQEQNRLEVVTEIKELMAA
jgi:hypothetical protein